MNKLHEAAATLRTGAWCKGKFRSDLDKKKGETFCAVGAMAKHMASDVTLSEDTTHWAEIDILEAMYSQAVNKAMRSEEAEVLRDVIVDHYGDVFITPSQTLSEYAKNSEPESVIFEFNDEIAESADEVAEIMEKAAARYDERV
jgi:hypothetical protein